MIETCGICKRLKQGVQHWMVDGHWSYACKACINKELRKKKFGQLRQFHIFEKA